MFKTSEVPKPQNQPNCHKVFTFNWNSSLFSFWFLSLGLGPVLICREKSRRSTKSLGFRSETQISLHHVSLFKMGFLKCQSGGSILAAAPAWSRCLFAPRAWLAWLLTALPLPQGNTDPQGSSVLSQGEPGQLRGRKSLLLLSEKSTCVEVGQREL